MIDTVITSAYIPMADGVKIPADFWMPQFSGKPKRIPAILSFTRYWRGYELTGDKKELQPLHEVAKYWNSHEYAFVVVDTRGSGASYGYREGEFSTGEINDLGEIVNYFSHTEWCDGNVIAEGTSYSANLALLSSISHPDPLRVAHGTSPDFDGYAQLMAPGGIQNKWLGETFTGMIQALDSNHWQEVLRYNPRKGGESQRFIRGVRPVDVQRYIDLELLNNPRDNPSSCQRVTTQVEEIIVDANGADVKEVFPNPHQVLFGLIPWTSVRCA